MMVVLSIQKINFTVWEDFWPAAKRKKKSTSIVFVYWHYVHDQKERFLARLYEVQGELL